MEKILRVQNLQKTFYTGFWRKPKRVLHNVSFELTQGVMSGFLGINGSGKTTTIKSLLKLIQPDSGEVSFFDNEKLSTDVKQKISFLPEKPQFYDHLSGEEFLRFTAQLSARSFDKGVAFHVDEVLDLVELKDAKKFRLREYSKGMYQRMGLAQAILRNPRLMILDEPMSDLDPAGRALVKEILKKIQSEKKVSIFISSHLLQDIESLCAEIVILNDGEIKYTGPTLNFINKLNPRFEIFYSQNEKIQSVISKSEEELQKQIDLLRAQKNKILSIQNQKSLEEAFKKFIEEF